jgi:trehalose-phosphatase
MVPDVLAAIGARPPRAHLVVLSDFDGTLASFDVDPSAPQLDDDTRHVLETLASRRWRYRRARQRTTCGRPGPPHTVADNVYLAGLHGMEIRHGNHAWHHPDLVDSHELIDRVTDAMNAAFGNVPGVRLEHKGVSLTVHVRAVESTRRKDMLQTAIDVARPWLDSDELKVLDASEAVELLPNIAWNKATPCAGSSMTSKRTRDRKLVHLLRRRCD